MSGIKNNKPIKVGDLLWDDVRKIFGIVSEEIDHEAFTWVASWNDGRQNWVDSTTIRVWKRNLEVLRSELNV
jgi:hypothetical protein